MSGGGGVRSSLATCQTFIAEGEACLGRDNTNHSCVVDVFGVCISSRNAVFLCDVCVSGFTLGLQGRQDTTSLLPPSLMC